MYNGIALSFNEEFGEDIEKLAKDIEKILENLEIFFSFRSI